MPGPVIWVLFSCDCAVLVVSVLIKRSPRVFECLRVILCGEVSMETEISGLSVLGKSLRLSRISINLGDSCNCESVCSDMLYDRSDHMCFTCRVCGFFSNETGVF